MDAIEKFLRDIAPFVPEGVQVAKISLQKFGEAIIDEAQIETTIIRGAEPRRTARYKQVAAERVLLIGPEPTSRIS